MERELYKKYRPKTLEDVIGNKSVISSIRSSIASGNVPHTILLSGPSGCGKTTIARILQHELGCSENDYEEYNCSDRNGVDFGREVIARMRFKPMSGKCRIWQMDECHMMSTACANVLLKPFEDTPSHVYFILTTSEPDKILAAVKTRATHYVVSSLNEKQILQLIETVCVKEKIEISGTAKEQIVANCNGSARSALVMLDQIKGLDENEIAEAIESIVDSQNQSIDLCRSLMGGKPWREVSSILAGLKEDPEKVRRAVLGYARTVLINPRGGDCERAFLIIQCFQNSFFNSGAAGLAASCYDVVTDKDRK